MWTSDINGHFSCGQEPSSKTEPYQDEADDHTYRVPDRVLSPQGKTLDDIPTCEERAFWMRFVSKRTIVHLSESTVIVSDELVDDKGTEKVEMRRLQNRSVDIVATIAPITTYDPLHPLSVHGHLIRVHKVSTWETAGGMHQVGE